MKEYQKLNIILGWIVFAFASCVYLLTIEPTVSFWDCGEYIATAYKLEVGHPPGGPFFQLTGRIFSMFTAPGLAAKMVNAMSALCSSFTILFLFWTITALAKLMLLKSGKTEMTRGKALAIVGSGLVGALSYTFTDSFWFSAVEGEVYAMSSFFTAAAFWAIFKWENVADEEHADRWIVLIAYLMGLSIGVHLLGLLTIPAMAFVYYFRKYEVTRKGIVITTAVSVIILFIVQYVIIQGVVNLASKFELVFVNSIGMPFTSGIIFYSILIIAGIIWLLNWSWKNNRPALNTAVLCFAAILIGYSSYGMILIRSTANTPMDENNPENAFAFLSYLSREQYGDRPLGYGQYFNAPIDRNNPYKDGTPVYTPDKEKGKYIISDDRKNSIPNYDPAWCTVFPRMYSEKSDHISAYKQWAGIKGTQEKKPSFGQNLKFFFTYQIGWMYIRYFMWNFAGRQNDTQGHGNITDGNWLSGISFIDSIRLGPQDNLPESVTKNKAYNKFYFLPLILGLLGLIFHYNNDKRGFLVVMVLFILTGVGIIVYLNAYPYQPRERDYAYAASFYAFSMWIGLGVSALFDALRKNINAVMSACIATLVCLIVPWVMAKDGWDDHDRSDRYTARDFAANYLNSCAPNAILFTNGDNDTFPLWYAQEVEGIRTDVRVMNLSLSNTDWYIDQMSRKAYDSDPLPFSMTNEKYRQGTRDYVPFYDRKISGYTKLRDIIDFIASDNIQTKVRTQSGKNIDYFPTKKFSIPVDSAVVVNNGTVPKELADNIIPAVEWDFAGNYIMKNSLMVLDLLATNNWERPVYFAITVGSGAYLNLEEYFQLEGLAYRLVPFKTTNRDGQTGRVATGIMYDNMLNKFKWGGMEKGGIYLDETNMRMTYNFRNNFARLADALLQEGKKDSAIAVLDRGIEVMPDETVPYNFFMLPMTEAYYRAGTPEKANKIVERLADIYEDDLNYYLSLEGEYAQEVDNDKKRAMSVMQRLMTIAKAYKQEELAKNIEERFTVLQGEYIKTTP